MPTQVREVTTDEGWDEAISVIRQLWSHRDEAFVRSWRDEDDYRLFGLYEDDDEHESTGEAETDGAELVAVAGISVQRVLHHERHVWIHDFVVDESRRGEGFGTELLRWVEDWGRERDCEYVALGCVDDNDEAREFYEDTGLEVWGQVMEREL